MDGRREGKEGKGYKKEGRKEGRKEKRGDGEDRILRGRGSDTAEREMQFVAASVAVASLNLGRQIDRVKIQLALAVSCMILVDSIHLVARVCLCLLLRARAYVCVWPVAKLLCVCACVRAHAHVCFRRALVYATPH